MTHIPNQHHFTQKSAHEVLDAILEARVSPVFIQNLLFYPFVIESLCLYLLCLRALGARDLCAPQTIIHTNNNHATGRRKTSMLYAAQR